jgi:serine protease Do
MLTAGGKGDQAHEEDGHGVLTKYILEGLDGSADRDDKGYVTFSDLASYVKPKVTRMTHNSQVPQYCSIDGEGEFVFVLTKAAPTAGDAPTSKTDTITSRPERTAHDQPRDLTIGPDLSSLVARIKNAVVRITVTHAAGQETPFKGDDFFDKFFKNAPPRQKREPKAKSMGSGFLISSDGYILTNSHVIDQAESIQVTLQAGTEYDAKVVGRDTVTDIALLRIKTDESLTPAHLGNSDKLRVGEPVIAVGYPWGLEQTVSSGIVSAKGDSNFIQTALSFHPGSSGGLLINMEGKVIGINTAILQQTQGIGFAVPINTVKTILPSLKTKGRFTRGFFGVGVQDIAQELAGTLKLTQGNGVLVIEVVKECPADTAGLRTGDILVEVNGKIIKDTRQLLLLIASLSVGEKAIVKVVRDSRPMTFSAVIAERKD